jgi:hypothetical protein
MQTLKQVYWAVWLPLCFIALFSAGWAASYYINKPIEETNPFCEDKKHRTAWLAKRGDTYKCFQQWNQWPNRAYGSIVPHEQQNYYSTPFHFIQRKLRFDFWEEE